MRKRRVLTFCTKPSRDSEQAGGKGLVHGHTVHCAGADVRTPEEGRDPSVTWHFLIRGIGVSTGQMSTPSWPARWSPPAIPLSSTGCDVRKPSDPPTSHPQHRLLLDPPGRLLGVKGKIHLDESLQGKSEVQETDRHGLKAATSNALFSSC